jgi:parallel beta-helix repeat protein
MKQLLLCTIAACIAVTSNAANYYFSANAGNDSRTQQEATNPATPWKTLDKLNAFFSQLQPGDSVLFNRGETFYGSFNVSKSGSQGAPIVISAYGSGARPVFTGFSQINTWNAISTNIYEGECQSCAAGLNTVLIDNALQPIGRFPNSDAPNGGHLGIESHNGKNSITDNELTSATNWTGAQVVIRKNEWIIDKEVITAHSGNTINFTNTTNYEPLDYYGYFIQNDPRTLDKEGEWFYDANTHKLRLYTAKNPATQVIKASTVNVIINCAAHDYITFDNIQVAGSNVNSLYVEYSNHITIQNSDFVYSGGYAIKGFILDHLTVENTNINQSLSNGIYIAPYCSNSLIRKNQIHNIGLFPGMGGNNNHTYEGLVIHGSDNLIELNKLDSIGYIAIRFFGDNALIKNNYVNHFAMTKDDGGGIYTNGDNVFHNQRIINNIVINGIGAPYGTNNTIAVAATGIYLDDRTTNVEISGNTISNCSENGIYLHNSHEIDVKNNTLFNNRIQSSMVHDVLEPADPIRNVNMYNNVLFSLGANQVISNLESTLSDIGQFGNFDSNYYCRPANEGLIVKTKAIGVEETYDLPGWKSTFNNDQNGKITPKDISAFSYKIAGNNLFPNGTFNSTASGTSSFSVPQKASSVWVNDGVLDGGALKTTYDTSDGSSNSADIIFNVGSITEGKTYVINFSMLGRNNNGNISVFLRNNSGSYNNLAEVNNFKNTSARSEQEFLFHATTSTSTATLVFKVAGTDCPLYLDNVELYEAAVNLDSTNKYVRFEFNETESPKTIALDGNYVDVANNKFSNTITLQPFTSSVLLKQAEINAPMQFVQFDGSGNSSKIDLEWTTANEINTTHFDIEKSPNGESFLKIGTMPAANVATGTAQYQYTDYNPLAKENYYRLKQYNKLGKTIYTKIALVSCESKAKMIISPNPAADVIRVFINTLQSNEEATLSIYSLSGVVVKTMPAILSNRGVSVDVSSLTPGIYIIHIAAPGITYNERLVKQ